MCLNIVIINQFIRIIMETETLDNLSRGERFEMLKKMCKSRTIMHITILAMVAVLFSILVFKMYSGPRPFDTKDMISFVIWLVIGCIAGWFGLYNYRFKKKIDDLETPEQLLSWFRKNSLIEKIAGNAGWLLIIVESVIHVNLFSIIEAVAAFVIILVLTIKSYGPWYRKEKEIIEQLQELIEK